MTLVETAAIVFLWQVTSSNLLSSRKRRLTRHSPGLTQPQIARKRRVSERTIRARLEELPPEPPKETTAADVLRLRMRANRGRNTF